jgi:probable HAF family extracellular repeat protein
MKRHMRSFTRGALLLAGVTPLLTSPGFADQTYLIRELGALGGGTSTAAAINNSNQVAGTSTTGAGGFDAFLISNGAIFDLGNSGGDSSGAALNSHGDVVGSTINSVTTTTNHPFLYHNGVFSDLGIPAGFSTGFGNGVNDADQVVGQLISGPRRTAVSHAFLWQNGAFGDLGTLGGNSASAAAINNLGQVVGSSVNASGQSHAFLWQNGAMSDLGTLPGGFASSATAINNAGQIVGGSATTNFGPTHAVLFQKGAVADLGVPFGFAASSANAINIHGVVVGSASIGSYRGVHAFVAQNGTISDLNRLIPGNSGSWILTTATGINDAGEIVGSGTTNGIQRAFLLTPTTTVTVPAVPIDLVANSGNAVVSLSWVGSTGATSYNVKRANSSAGPFLTIATVAATSFTDTAVANCTTYDYVASAVNSAGESPNSSTATGAPQPIPPAPSGLSASPNTQQNLYLGSAISLAWRNNAGSCSEFVIIERSTDGVNFQTLATMGNIQTSYTDGFLNTGTRYYYRARAQSNGGESGPSNTASTVAPNSPY